jgi:hypothetical protein
MAKETIEMGIKSLADVDIDKLADDVIKILFCPPCEPDYKPALPDKDGNIFLKQAPCPKLPDFNISETISGITLKATGGIRDIIELIVKVLYKIVGFFVENFIFIGYYGLKPLIALILYDENNLLGPPPGLNLGKIPQNFINQTLAAAVPATAAITMPPIIAQQVINFKNQAESIQKLIETLNGIITAITDMGKFINSQLITQQSQFQSQLSGLTNLNMNSLTEGKKPFDNIKIPIPKMELGIMGLEIGPIDKNNLTTTKGSPFDMTKCTINLPNLVKNPKEEITKFLVQYASSPLNGLISGLSGSTEGLSDKMGLSNFGQDTFDKLNGLTGITSKIQNPTIDLSDIDFFSGLTNSSIKQLNFIKNIPNKDDFYRMNQDGFDFFTKFDLNTQEKFKKKLKDINLHIDFDFVNKFYNQLKDTVEFKKNAFEDKLDDFVDFFIKTPFISPITGLQVNFTDKYKIPFKDKLLPNLDLSKYQGIEKVYKELNLDPTDLIGSLFHHNLNLSFKLKTNFENPFDEEKMESLWDKVEDNFGKKFKLKFWDNIPADKLDFLKEFQVDFSNVLQIADMSKLDFNGDGSNVKELGKSLLETQTFKDAIKFPDVKELDLPEIDIGSLTSLIKQFEDKLPGIITWFVNLFDTIKNIIMFPINLIMGLLKNVINIIKKLMTLNIPKAFEFVTELLKTITNPMEIVTKAITTIIQPMIDDFNENIIKDSIDKMAKNTKLTKDNLIEFMKQNNIDTGIALDSLNKLSKNDLAKTIKDSIKKEDILKNSKSVASWNEGIQKILLALSLIIYTSVADMFGKLLDGGIKLKTGDEIPGFIQMIPKPVVTMFNLNLNISEAPLKALQKLISLFTDCNEQTKDKQLKIDEIWAAILAGAFINPLEQTNELDDSVISVVNNNISLINDTLGIVTTPEEIAQLTNSLNIQIAQLNSLQNPNPVVYQETQITPIFPNIQPTPSVIQNVNITPKVFQPSFEIFTTLYNLINQKEN